MPEEAAVLRVLLDPGGQRRQDPERPTVRIYLNGLDWDVGLSQNVWFDPTSKAVLRRPAFMSAEWQQSNTGIYEKLIIGGGDYGYSLTTPSKWQNHLASSAGGHWFVVSQDVDEAVVSSSTWATNQPFYICWFVHARDETNADDGTCLECGWGVPTGVSQTALRVYPSGRIQVYRNGEQVYDGDGWTSPETSPQKTKRGGSGVKTDAQFAGYWIEPFDLGLLVTSTATGKSLHVRFEDIDPVTATPPPIPEAQFWWWVRRADGSTTNPQATVQAAPVQYLPGAFVVSDVVTLDRLPPEDVSPVLRYIASGETYLATADLLNEDGSGPWDGASLTLRVKVYLDESEIWSGAIYAVELEWPGATIVTDGDDALDLNELADDEQDSEELGSFALQRLHLSKPDQVGGFSASLTVRNPGRIDDRQGAAAIRTMANRACWIQWGRASLAGLLLDGRTGSPRATSAINVDAETLDFDIEDARKALESYRFRTRKYLGGMTFSDALRYLFKAPGVFTDEDLDGIEENTFRLPVDNAAGDDAALVIQVGDTAAEWIDRLMDDFSPLDFCDIVPQAEGRPRPVYRTLYAAPE